ncbi:xanthine dehydrogenase accessory protein XdhC [Acinetobacter sp. MD2]|uniref:xanthine dehydrogenase accessory protein XdhC n=1 Tax=Acinetobacter sp. MD2 TaxID=2600066 RepID=UPI002D1F3DC6|nr:xanthine dehydrogenase accessory protein XdhC [Acinetobacter sp. MD2]MEB3766206.1 xanthine dehydrogenase accessory protein XdhC [Acinetobacter sp. MD2]
MQQHLQWWKDLSAWGGDPCAIILVTVVRADGSTPREVGATMLLRFDSQQKWQQSDTIGGGHLEFQAIDIAKAMLAGSEQRILFVERFNLSARLGQCCGGVMWLLFEKITFSQKQNIADTYTAWQAGHVVIRELQYEQASKWHVLNESTVVTCEFWQKETRWKWQQVIQPYAMNVLIFGAGHVGEAIVRCLLPIGVKITWVDSRQEIFPQDLLPFVHCIDTDIPEQIIEKVDRNTAVLILTHDHQLDLQLCFAALKSTQPPFAYVGMIGSKSKRAIFEKRMTARGYSQTELGRLVCPIGIAGISSKQPAIIAVSVVAQLLQVFDVKK